MSHGLIITDNSYRSCLILIYTACEFCVHASCHETAKGLAIISSLQNYVCVRGPVYRDLGVYTSRIFEHGKRRRVGMCRIFNMLFIETAKRPLLKTLSLEQCAKYKTCAKMCKVWKPVQYAQVSYFAHFFETIFCNFEINGYFHFFIYLFIFFFLGGGGGGGVILEGFISGT